MANTHYYGVIHDGHGRGVAGAGNPPGPRIMDPVLGQYLQFGSAPSPALAVNQIIRSTASYPTGSGCWGRVIQVITTDTCIIESFNHPVFGIPGGAFKAGEAITIDSGASTTIGLAGLQQEYRARQQFLAELMDAELNSFTPDDRTDTPWFDPGAKRARELVLSGASVAGDVNFIKGERCTTSGGAAFTILAASVDGSDYRIWIINLTGSLAVSDVVTNAHAETGDILTVEDDPPEGAWIPHHVMPNHNGLPASGDIWEFPPTGSAAGQMGFGVTPQDKIIRRAYLKHVEATDPTDRGVRILPMSTNREVADAYRFIAGITLQTVVCTGTFPSTWTPGEIVTAVGGWVGTVHSYDATNKYLYVKSTNGVALGNETVTGQTSLSVATSIGPAYGWQKGSAYYQEWFDRIAEADAADGALYMAQPRRWEGLMLFIWEADANMFASGSVPWPSEAEILSAWLAMLSSFRADMGRTDLPIAVWQPHPYQKADVVALFGVPYAYYIRQTLEKLPALDSNIRLVRSSDLNGATDATGDYPTAFLYFRPMDYLTLGERAWRAVNLQNVTVPVGNFEVMPIIISAGQSQRVGGINAITMMAVDKDPLLYPSASFPGVNTVDPNVLKWNNIDHVWEPYDAALNANTFFGITPGTCGPELSELLRLKRRFDQDDSDTDVSRIGLIKIPVNGASANANVKSAPATFDPTMVNRVTFDDTMVVGALAATSLLPQRGRFIATAGLFSDVAVNDAVSVSGSALGVVGYGGNNTATYGVAYVVQISDDGSWIELSGAFVNEGPIALSVSHGPVPIAPVAEEEIRLAIAAASSDLRAIAIPVAIIWENGESDLALVDEYKAALLRVFEWLERIIGGRIKGQIAVPKAIVQLSSNTPWGVSDETVAQMRSIQAEVASELENAVVVDPSACPLESSGAWPINSRLDNGVHRTARGHIMCGYLVDAALGSLEGIPAHPDGAAALDFGVDGGLSGFTDEVDAPEDAVIILEDGTGVEDANAYFDYDFVDDYNDNNDQIAEWYALTTLDKQKHIRRGTAMVMRDYTGQWNGLRTYEVQRMPFPRTGIVDPDGFLIGSSTIPLALKEACAEAALRSAQDKDLIADEEAGQNLSAESITIDVISLQNEYVGRKQTAPVFKVVRSILIAAGLISSGFTIQRA